MEDVAIVGTCDADPTKATYERLDQMLDELQPDFLDITTRPEQHLEMVRTAVERGIPVICQKPVAPHWREAVEMVELAEAADVPLVIHENWRWQPWYRVVQAELQKGLIGPPVTYTFRTRKLDGDGPDEYPTQPYFRTYPRLLLFETLVHHLDTARFLFGEIEEVYARSRRVNPLIQGEDQVLLLTGHATGLNGVFDGHRFLDLRPDSPPLGDFTVDGIGASLQVDAAGDVWLWNGRERKMVWQNTVGQGYRGDSVRAVCRHFVDQLRGQRRWESTGREYLRTIACVEAGYCSMASGRAESTRTFNELPATGPT
jgi:predicted dehydrogenase